ncbi:MAG: rRNA maturation RNase YbeY [Acidobacteria bacterium]|nr:rRNA maturation RNase YbeY [Acidobacteriota bacterium]
MAPGDQRRAPRRLQVIVTDERGGRVRSTLGSWLERVAPASARGTVGVALVSDARVRALNRQYRGKDYATDVLSFPTDAADRSATAVRTGRIAELGDIVIARGVARRQAREAGHPEWTELRVLALHGLLHLLGYDHETDRGEMARLEQRLRRKGGLREGLIERA